jgi:hypothetical protein
MGVGRLCPGGWALIGLTLVAGCGRVPPESHPGVSPDPPPSLPVRADSAETLRLGNVAYRISGPYSHANLSVYFLHSDIQDDRNFITLAEGFRQHLVRVTEKDRKEVNELLISNLSDRPLFLQEGDRLKGGDQDRTLRSSLVIPPGAKRVRLPAFCIEHGRWVEGRHGNAFAYADGMTLAPRSVRAAAKIAKDQQQVWDSVAREKQVAGEALGAPSVTSSLNETLDSGAVAQAIQGYSKALAGILADKKDAVGVAIVVNGVIEEVDIYPGHPLLGSLYPRLVRSYAVQAAAQQAQGAPPAPPTPAEVIRFMQSNNGMAERREAIDRWNSLALRELGDRVECVTRYNGEPVHQQFMRRERPAARPGAGEGRQPLSSERH